MFNYALHTTPECKQRPADGRKKYTSDPGTRKLLADVKCKIVSSVSSEALQHLQLRICPYLKTYNASVRSLLARKLLLRRNIIIARVDYKEVLMLIDVYEAHRDELTLSCDVTYLWRVLQLWQGPSSPDCSKDHVYPLNSVFYCRIKSCHILRTQINLQIDK